MPHTLKSSFLIAAATSGSGKTTLTMGLLRALCRRGLSVQPFKCGPDYIDPKYHALASGRESVNLDTWLASPEHVRHLYGHYTQGVDVAVTEGVMGLFDGFGRSEGSSAHVARLLDIPVVLVVSGRSVAYSVAPLIYGFRHFDTSIRIAGVIFNQVASATHASILRMACEDVGVPCLGYLPRMKDIELPSRHLGLTLDAEYRLGDLADRIAVALEEHVDIDRLLGLTQGDAFDSSCLSDVQPMAVTFPVRRIAVARDEAFNFTYRYNLERLSRSGELCYFSPLTDTSLPDADFVYLPGGYPEFFLPTLASNVSMLESIRQYAASGGRILAECGGMMYLSRQIHGMDGVDYPMADVLPIQATMEGMRLHLGYRAVTCGNRIYRGHEFHYSDISSLDESLKSIAVQTDARGHEVPTALYRRGNVIAGYTHLYWGETNLFDLFDESLT